VGGAGADLHAGGRLRATFVEAGRPAPETRLEALVAGGDESPYWEYVEQSVRSMLPEARRLGLDGFDESRVAGLGTRLRPITYALPKPMAPVLNRPVMEHIARLLARHGFGEAIANLHWFPETIEGHFGDGSEFGIELTYSREEALLGRGRGSNSPTASSSSCWAPPAACVTRRTSSATRSWSSPATP